MKKINKLIVINIIVVFNCFLLTKTQAQSTGNKENHRPKLHYTAEKNWINDPNGMFFYEGEYHLYYQHNPYGDKWGHMSWGHAVSRDLIKWKHLPNALEEENDVMIFSGSAVVDWKNSSGFGMHSAPPIVAVYTSYDAKTGLQHQSIAYSNDKGRTFTKYQGNPVLNLNSKDFRDPKVFWYEPEQKWIMAVVLSVEKKLQFYSSKNLKEWGLMSEFGPTGAVNGIWECPDLFTLTHKGITKWVLGISLGDGSVAGGSGMQYFIGNFDGKTFTADPSVSGKNGGVKYIDYGKDFYAAITWNGAPAQDGSQVWLGWMNNWQYANDIPSFGWRGSMSLPRKLILDKSNGDYFLRQKAIPAVDTYRISETNLKKETVAKVNQKLQEIDLKDLAFELDFKFSPIKTGKFLDFEILNNSKSVVKLAFNNDTNEFVLTRIDKGISKEEFQSVQKVFIGNNDTEMIDVRLFVDKNSIEIFINEGKFVFTNLIFPEDFNTKIQFNSSDNTRSIFNSISIFKY